MGPGQSHLLYFIRPNLSEMVQGRLRQKHATAESLNNEGEQRLSAAIPDKIKRVRDARGIASCFLDIPRASNVSNLPREYLQAIVHNDIVDLREEFAKQMKAGNKLYWTRSDGHWTPLGHRIAARALYGHIQSNRLIEQPKSATPDGSWRP